MFNLQMLNVTFDAYTEQKCNDAFYGPHFLHYQ